MPSTSPPRNNLAKLPVSTLCTAGDSPAKAPCRAGHSPARATRNGLASLAAVGLVAAGLAFTAGCAHIPNYYQEDGPSVTANWDSPTAADVKSRFQLSEQRHRDWPERSAVVESGAVAHWPLYFEDPFVDKGAGRTDETDPHNVYRLGWEDWLAFPYGIARFTGNWLMLPVSAIVTPPWTVMESDGRLSRQFLGYDHDAAPVDPTWLGAPTARAGAAEQP